MPMLYSGAIASPDNGVVPTLQDIGLSLSRLPRFVGMTRRWWSVLDHSLYVYHMARAEAHDDDAAALAMLLHDAHESMTADIPTSMKTSDMRQLQAGLDVRIVNAYFPGGIEYYRKYDPYIHALDNRALLAEARVVGPPAAGKSPLHVFENIWGGLPYPEDIQLLQELVSFERLSRPGLLWRGTDSPQVREYVRLVEQLRSKLALVQVGA